MKVAFVGQGPNRACWEDGLRRAGRHGHFGMSAEAFAERYCARLAITGRVGRQLSLYAGMNPLAFYSRHHRFNLNARWSGKTGKGDVFDMEEAKATALRLLIECPAERWVLLGHGVAWAFGIAGAFLDQAESAGRRFLVFPHPSGINAWWNDGHNRWRAGLALEKFIA